MISVLYTIILITNFKLIEMCIKSSRRRGEQACQRLKRGWRKVEGDIIKDSVNA